MLLEGEGRSLPTMPRTRRINPGHAHHRTRVVRRGAHYGDPMTFTWRLHDPTGATLDPAGVGVEVPAEESQGDAESLLAKLSARPRPLKSFASKLAPTDRAISRGVCTK